MSTVGENFKKHFLYKGFLIHLIRRWGACSHSAMPAGPGYLSFCSATHNAQSHPSAGGFVVTEWLLHIQATDLNQLQQKGKG